MRYYTNDPNQVLYYSALSIMAGAEGRHYDSVQYALAASVHQRSEHYRRVFWYRAPHESGWAFDEMEFA